MAYGLIKNFVKDEKGNTFLNQLLRFTRGVYLVPRETNNPLTVGANAISSEIIIEGPQEATTQIYALNGFHGAADDADVINRLTVEITDTRLRRRLMNRDVLADHVFGDNQQQCELMETLMLQGKQTLKFVLRNNSAAGDSNFSFGARGVKLQNADISQKYAEKLWGDLENRKTYLYPYWFTFDTLPLVIPAGLTYRAFMSNTTDVELALFWAMKRWVSSGVAGDTNQGFLAEMIDPETQTPCQSAPKPSLVGFGLDAREPRPFGAPVIVPPNTQIIWDIQNLITDAQIEIWLTLFGVACYQGDALGRVPNKGIVQPAPFLKEQYD